MFPPKVEDNEIRRLIRELAVEGRLPSGAALRVALATRYGSRGGVTRIYRLLATEASELSKTSPASVAGRLLEHEVCDLREQLQRVRQREEAHQSYWTRQVGELRERVEKLEPRVQGGTASDPDPDGLQREVQHAEIRAGQLEVALRVFGPAWVKSEAKKPD